jgi:SAM-dependent methyltransferase
MTIPPANADAVTTTLIRTPLVCDADTGLWTTVDSLQIDYDSDPFARDQLGSIIASATDLSSLSTELEQLGRDWPACYYLSSRRTNLFRGFEWERNARVLEVGAGCGTISRFLGETFRSTTSIEGDTLRAKIAASRVRDQSNVSVVCAPYDQLEFSDRFDAIFCIGVLEYAGLYNPSAEPLQSVLHGFRETVRDEGTLVLAIENKLGMKYLGGAAEDHTGGRFDGLEGYRRTGSTGPITLGRVELADMLGRAGFDHVQFYYPFPDYKFARCLIADRAAHLRIRNVADLICPSSAAAYSDAPQRLTFDQRSAWREACMNGLLPDLANSFLAFASPRKPHTTLASSDWDACMINTAPRARPYWTKMTVRGLSSGDAVVTRTLLDEEAAVSTHDRLVRVTPYREPWYSQPSLGTQAEDLMIRSDCTVSDLVALLMPWANYLRAATDPNGLLPVDMVDAMPQNLVVLSDGTVRMFDRELSYTGALLDKIVLARGLCLLFGNALRDQRSLRRYRGLPLAVIAIRVARGLGFHTFGIHDLWAYCQFEDQMQREVANYHRTPRARMKSLYFNRVSLFGRDAGYATADLALLAYKLARRLRR